MNSNKKEKKHSKVNIQIVIVTWFFVALFVAMSVYIVKYSIENKQELISNSYNGRQKILAAQNIRGSILDRNGNVLASSSVNASGTEVREYAYGNLFAHAVGYAVNGKMGVEEAANYYLINSNAPISVKAKCDANGIKYPGDDVYTTLDMNLQKVAFDALGVYKGAIICTEPSTGKILAMVSKPDFNPATVAENWNDYINDKDSGVLVNRVTQGLYPPGSTFKIIDSIEYIRENPSTYSKYRYTCTGSIKNGEDKIQCYHGSVHNSVDFMKSFAKSCNTSFANIGLSFDRNEFGKTLNDLLFNSQLPTSLTTSVSKLVVNEFTTDSEMMQISIGQGSANITPIQLNMITCAIANKGVLVEPYIISKVVNSEGSSVKNFKSTTYGSLLTEEEAAIIFNMMENVVDEGTGTKLKGLKYYAGGKTGSAEYGTIKGESHAWFTGFAGMEDKENPENSTPDICVTIIVEGAGAGGEYAVPIARRLFDAYYGITYEDEIEN